MSAPRTAIDDAAAAPPGGEEALSVEEIEAILEAEGASPPESDQAPPKLDVVQREPGNRAWVAWLLIAFMLLGGLRYWLDPAWKF